MLWPDSCTIAAHQVPRVPNIKSLLLPGKHKSKSYARSERGSMRSGARVVILLIGLFLLLNALLTTQTATTSLRGTVYDPKGAVVSGATITIADPSTGFTRRATSDSQGSYQFLELPPATYDV